MQVPLRFDVPPLGRALPLRGAPVAVRLERFAPSQFDAWLGSAAFPAGVATGVPSVPPLPLAGSTEGEVVARAVVVRHAGNVAGRTPWRAAARRRLGGLNRLLVVPDEPLVAVVVEASGATLVWLRGEPAAVVDALSQPDWRAHAG